MPNTLLTASIQAPDFGSRIENPAIAQNGTPIPTAYVASRKKPANASRVVATNARMPASGGPVQGAAMSPPTSPIRNAPPALRPPTRLSRCLQPRRQRQLERAEHRRRHQREEQRQGHDDPRIGQERAERLADQREHGAERSEHHRDAGDVEGRQQQARGRAARPCRRRC